MSIFQSCRFPGCAAFVLSLSLMGCSIIDHEQSSIPMTDYTFAEPIPYPDAALPTPAPAVSLPEPSIRESWPADIRGLVYVWQQGDSEGLELRGKAKLDTAGRLDVSNGSAIVAGIEQQLLDACRKSGELTIEVLLTTSKSIQNGPARIVTFSTDASNRNFTLGQDGKHLILRLRTPETGSNGFPPETRLAPIQVSKPMHIVVSYRPGNLVCSINGEEVLRTSEVRGDLSNWSAHSVVLGDELKDPRDWSGTISRIALRSRFVDSEEAGRLFELLDTNAVSN